MIRKYILHIRNLQRRKDKNFASNYIIYSKLNFSEDSQENENIFSSLCIIHSIIPSSCLLSFFLNCGFP